MRSDVTNQPNMAHSIAFLILLSPLLLSAPSSAGSILLTGEIYPLSRGSLSTPINAFIGNNAPCRSNTRHPPSNCTLGLTDRGQLLIQSPNGSTLWSSSPPIKTGRYAALFLPDGHVTIYGPLIWSAPRRGSVASRAAEIAEAKNSPRAPNLMLSSQVLDDSWSLMSRGNTLSMRDDCNLELVDATEGVVWESGTKGMGRNCFLRLDHRGQLAVVDAKFKIVWATEPEAEEGLYVLIVQDDGQAAVYGPAI